jgi:AcrR family transcriptional regulator
LLTVRPDAPTFVEQARRQQMVQGTIEVLAERGYAATSLAVVATHLGISKGLLHYHFRDKDELLRVVVATIRARRAQEVTARVASATTPAEAVTAYVAGHLDHLAAHPADALALREIQAGLPPDDPDTVAARAEALDALALLVSAGQRAGSFRHGDPRLAAFWIMSVIDAFPAFLQTEPHLDVEAAITELGRLVLGSLGR